MYELKTKQNELSVDAYIDAIADETRREDCRTVIKLMTKATKEKPKMWGPSIVGFGSYHYKYDSGHEGDMCITGFSSRKNDLTLYLIPGFEQRAELMEKLGKHKNGKSCLYIKRLADIDQKVLTELITLSVKEMKARYK
ncbi:MAG: DUF1801 domain-containing protein [Betaproteobacteria bacterium]|nr:DUF1801 domain-containing protein [Betaproteobacteria bacterium]